MIQLNDLIFYSVMVVLMIGVGVMGWVLYYGNKHCNVLQDETDLLETYDDNNKVITIYDEHDKLVNIDFVEKAEQDLAEKYIHETDVCLELGARYGSVSCKTNKKLLNRHLHVVVEPDKTVWKALEKNKKINNCQFKIVKGFISAQKLGLNGTGYATTNFRDESSDIPIYSLADIQRTYNIAKFTALIVDCEGCMETFLNENEIILKDLRLVMFEADEPSKCNYEKIKGVLRNYNFKMVVNGFQNLWVKSI